MIAMQCMRWGNLDSVSLAALRAPGPSPLATSNMPDAWALSVLSRTLTSGLLLAVEDNATVTAL